MAGLLLTRQLDSLICSKFPERIAVCDLMLMAAL